MGTNIIIIIDRTQESSSPLVEVEHVDVDPSGFIKHGWRDKIPLFAKVRGNNHTGDGKDEPSEWFRAASIVCLCSTHLSILRYWDI
jgi:hypothetical protein